MTDLNRRTLLSVVRTSAVSKVLWSYILHLVSLFSCFGLFSCRMPCVLCCRCRGRFVLSTRFVWVWMVPTVSISEACRPCTVKHRCMHCVCVPLRRWQSTSDVRCLPVMTGPYRHEAETLLQVSDCEKQLQRVDFETVNRGLKYIKNSLKQPIILKLLTFRSLSETFIR